MASKPILSEMFQEWNELNSKAQESMRNFDFATIKTIREGQKKIEDSIFEILKENAPENIKEILPEDCGEMEVGYDTEGKIFFRADKILVSWLFVVNRIPFFGLEIIIFLKDFGC